LEEPEQICAYVENFLDQLSQVKSERKKILITAGPTREALDPVRYISNHSTGKMGFALAKAALAVGHEVLLLTGPTQLKLSHPHLQVLRIESAQELLQEVQTHWN